MINYPPRAPRQPLHFVCPQVMLRRPHDIFFKNSRSGMHAEVLHKAFRGAEFSPHSGGGTNAACAAPCPATAMTRFRSRSAYGSRSIMSSPFLETPPESSPSRTFSPRLPIFAAGAFTHPLPHSRWRGGDDAPALKCLCAGNATFRYLRVHHEL